MTMKKKKKTRMNAIDKYLQQKKYSRGRKTSEPENSEERVVKVVVPKLNRSKHLCSSDTFPDRNVRRSARSVTASTLDEKVGPKERSELKTAVESTNSKKTNMKKSKKVLVIKSGEKQELEDKRKQLENKQNKIKRNRSQVKKDKSNLNKRTENSSDSEYSSQSAKTLLNEHNDENYFQGSSAESNTDFSRTNQGNVKRKFNCANTLKNSDRLDVSNINGITESISTTELANRESNSANTVPSRKRATESNKLVKKKRKVEFSDESSNVRDLAPTNEPCCSYVSSSLEENIIPKKEYLLMYNDREIQSYISDGYQSSDAQIVEETTPITKKYQPYMERLKLLTSDAIKKFITDNQQYYVDFKNEIESKTTTTSASHKKWKKSDEMRESFKCNPFNSDQQLAMYYTLREIFKVPKAHFKECRNFFTVLIPEISCQLFAETFRIKVSFAPRLIKKLYPNPVCPI